MQFVQKKIFPESEKIIPIKDYGCYDGGILEQTCDIPNFIDVVFKEESEVGK